MTVEKIYIHIGPPKCATTTIQAFLRVNKDALIENGILYPTKPPCVFFDGQHPLMKHYHDNPRSNGKVTWVPYHEKQEVMDAIMSEIAEHKPKTLVLSSENFWNIDKFDELKEDLSKISKTVIPFTFIRRQDLRVESLYRELRKSNHLILPDNFFDIPYGDLDYDESLGLWADTFGKENIIVHVLERKQLKKDIREIVADIIGLPFSEDLAKPPSLNISYNQQALHYISNFPGSRKFTAFYISTCPVLDEYSKKNPDPPEYKFFSPPEKRLLILETYQQSNKKVAIDYLHREDDDLFLDDIPSLDDPWKPFEPSLIETTKITINIILWYAGMLFRKQRRQLFIKAHKNRKRSTDRFKNKKSFIQNR